MLHISELIYVPVTVHYNSWARLTKTVQDTQNTGKIGDNRVPVAHFGALRELVMTRSEVYIEYFIL